MIERHAGRRLEINPSKLTLPRIPDKTEKAVERAGRETAICQLSANPNLILETSLRPA